MARTSEAATARPYLPETGGAVAFHTRGEATVKQGPAHSIDLRVPEPRFPRHAADRQHVGPARTDPAVERPGVDQLRWARCPDLGLLHLVQAADVTLAAAKGYAQAFCGHQIVAEGLTITSAGAGALCMACVMAATS